MADIKKVLLDDNVGKCVLLLGNEAITRGILETGIGFVTTYPGTPASEIADTSALVAKDAGLYMEYSTNEIVALETAAGAAICKVRALTAMKHVGLNVAADALMVFAYTGVRAALVIVTADDPECYSSQNEQDNRYYALLSNLPLLEPTDAQEAKDMVAYGVDISEELEVPCLFRTTTRVAHTRTPVVLGKIQKPNLKGEFIRDPKRFVMVPENARVYHKVLLEKMEKARTISEKSRFNKVVRTGTSTGIITSGIAYNYAAEAVDLLKLDVSILKLGMTHPLPKNKIADFLRGHKRIVIIEELEPYLETQIKAIAKDCAPAIEISGRTGIPYFPSYGELSTRTVMEGLTKILDKKSPIAFTNIDKKYREAVEVLLPRPPILCPGCPHRASFYVIRIATSGKAIYSTDIGCYALGYQAPLQIGDLMFCMGASVGTACGISKAMGQDTLAIVGDSTFFHATIPGLINAVYNNHKVTLVVLDNTTTAMTGHQPHPGTGKTGMNVPTVRVSIEEVARGCGVKYVKVITPFRVKEATNIVREALNTEGPAVIIFRSPCTLLTISERRRQGLKVTPCRVTEKCTNCMACLNLLGCPALDTKENKIVIKEALCTACMLCATICPIQAIEKCKA
ncbi:MAG TPA: indolepyruvate ferredoxin oxidoreductase subunit alpha [Candidatus Bathyarchaeia archaeon]|nr:indolepyruvate ferredoxin oxidoreductase subunit alpha [Candidatus Bathyarchaeia archaeon]